MSSTTRIAHWLAWTAGMVFLGAGILNAQVSLPTSKAATPPVLIYSNLLEGWAEDLVIDGVDNAYVLGSAYGGHGGMDVFVGRLSLQGELQILTFLGGSVNEQAGAIAVDAAGDLYVTGFTNSPDFHPAMPIPDPEEWYGDAFAARLSASGPWIKYSNRLYAGNPGWGRAIAADSRGYAYISGLSNFSERGFLAKLDPIGQEVGWWTLLPEIYQVAIDTADNLYIAGFTQSCPGSYDQLNISVEKLDPDGKPIYRTCIGGSSLELLTGLAVDAAGNLYLTGITYSSDFPLRNPVQDRSNGSGDIFIVKLDPAGELAFSTYLGGHATDRPAGLAVDRAGYAYVTGSTESVDFPLQDPTQEHCVPSTNLTCTPDAFVVKIATDGQGLAYSSFLGGTGGDSSTAIAIDSAGDAYILGSTFSTDFPTTGSEGSGRRGSFIVKISFNRPPDCSAATASPSSLWPPNGKLVPIAIQGVADPNGDPVTLKVTGIRQDEPLSSWDGFDATGLSAPAAMLRADRAGGGDGRVYRLAFEARDDKGATCTGTVKVCVPHDSRPGATCGDGGPLFDSTGK